jgi:rsbT antagonist protein RsbS
MSQSGEKVVAAYTQLLGMHLTEIGQGVFLLEPSRSLDISNSDEPLLNVLERLQQTQASKLYYELGNLPLIDPLYYEWLNRLARACGAINVAMVCINFQPTAAFALSHHMKTPPAFTTALGIRERT